jgi:hypothetical protein
MRLDPNCARGAKTLSQPATLQPATQHRAKRGQCHVTMDAQDIIGGVEFVEEGAHEGATATRILNLNDR